MQQIPAAMVAADVATQAELDAEGTTRGNADTALSTRVTTLEGHVPTLNGLQATTSGTSFTVAVPSWAKRFTLIFQQVSLSGTANLIVQVGPVGGIVTSGYVGGASQAGASPAQATYTQGLEIGTSSTAASTHTGRAMFEMLDAATNAWVGVSTSTRSDGYGQQGGTYIALAGVLTQLKFTTTNGTDTFDGGSFNVLFE